MNKAALPSRLHYLGPPGTFSERAAGILALMFSAAPELELTPEPNFAAIATAASASPSKDGITAAGVLPYYNLLEGLVQEGIDLIYEHNLRVLGAARVPVRFAAGSLDGTPNHPVAVSHPKALAQCEDWLKRWMPDAEQRAATSTADAPRLASTGGMVALADATTLEKYGMRVFARDIGNRRFGRTNFTDFLLVASEEVARSMEPRNKKACAYRTLLAITPRYDCPGLLGKILGQLSFAGLNIAKIHSRPAIEKVETNIEPQMFYLELAASAEDPAVTGCVDSLSSHFTNDDGPSAVRVLGDWAELSPPLPEVPPEELRDLSPCLVVGCNGGFGRSMIALLRGVGIFTMGVDRADVPPPDLGLGRYWQADASRLPAEALAEARWILLCVPEEAVLAAIPTLASLPADRIVSDVASVKSRIAAEVQAVPLQCGWLSLHPMYGPSLAPRGRNICLIPMRSANKPAHTAIELLLAGLGARLTSLTSEQHDRVTSQLQAAAHTALMALGRSLEASKVDPDLALRLATPINGALFSMLARMTDADADLYQSIQTENPFAGEARQILAAAIAELDKDFLANRPGAVKEVFAASRFAFGEHFDELVAAARRVALTLTET